MKAVTMLLLAAVRALLRKRRQQPGAMTPSGTTETVGTREVTEFEYPSRDGRDIPTVLSMPRGEGPFPVFVTIHGGQGERDFQFHGGHLALRAEDAHAFARRSVRPGAAARTAGMEGDGRRDVRGFLDRTMPAAPAEEER